MERVVKESRCLFCSLGCRCQVELGEAPWKSLAPQDANGLCARAFFIADLMSHPGRINLAARRGDGRLATTALDEAIAAIAERIGPAGPTAIIVDGSYPSQSVGAALSLAAEAAETVGAVYLPAGDAAMLAGLQAAGWTQGALPGDGNDTVLVVGDAFATHPPIARRALDVKFADRGNRLLVVSPFGGRTASFASQAAVVAPGGEAALLLGVARRLEAEVPGVDAEADAPAAESIATALAGAKAPAIVLSQPEGTTANAHIAACAAAAIAAKLDAPLLPLFTYGNALGAWRAAADAGATPMADVVAQAAAGEIKNLVIIGVDLAAALPDLGAQMLGAAEFVAAAASFPNATTARAHVVVPLGLCCEEEGQAALPDGQAVDLAPPAPPVGGALTVDGLVEKLRQRLALDPANRLEPPATAAQPWQLAPAPEGEAMSLIASGDVLGFADGSLSRQNWWAQAVRAKPTLTLNPADSRRTGVFAGSTAVVKTAAGEAELAVETSQDVPPGVASVPLCFAQTRRLFRWEAVPQAATLCCGPVEVTIRAAS